MKEDNRLKKVRHMIGRFVCRPGRVIKSKRTYTRTIKHKIAEKVLT